MKKYEVKIGIILIIIGIIGSTILFKFFKTHDKLNEVYIGYYNGEEKLSEMPLKDNSDNLVFDYGECDNGANIEWDSNEWAPLIKDLSKSKTKCSLYFREKASINICNKYGNDSALCYITKLGDTDYENMLYDHASANGVVDNNLRYAGINPNNYIDIGDRDSNGSPILWRIIGIMNNIDNGSETKESRIKIIRSEKIGNYAWDLSSNNWATSELMKVLNEGAYWNKTIGKCPIMNSLTTDCNFSSIGISENAKSLIDNAKWALGGHTTNSLNASQFYEKEHGKEVFEGNETEWKGKVGLMYPSDYLYAVSPKMTKCKNIINNNYTTFNCYQNNWLFTGEVQWTITAIKSNSLTVSRINLWWDNNDGNIYFNDINSANNSVRPVAYLSSNVKISNGNGTKSSPYIIEV